MPTTNQGYPISILSFESRQKTVHFNRQGMDIEAAEKWIVDLIRGSKLDAKIDSRDNNVIMGGSYPSVYQQARRGILQVQSRIALAERSNR